jgi:hypothetical protein
MRIPIACTLDDIGARAQLAEWRQVVAESVRTVERLSPSSAALVLEAGRPGLEQLIELAQREKACCAFFDFSLAIEADRVSFVVSVPPEASGILDQFLAAQDPPTPISKAR